MKAFNHGQYIILLLFFTIHQCCLMQAQSENSSTEFVTIAILAKDKQHTLPLYLACIENQTWPASKTHLYIRTNNNNDDTACVLRDWIDRVGSRYAKIYFDDSDIAEQVQEYGQHEWNYTRFKVLGAIRQDSVAWAQENNSHYFVADCDNFIYPTTIEDLVRTNQPIIAPLLRCGERSGYSNYHYAIDMNGYMEWSSFYYNVLDQEIKGIIEVPVVHCTYFVRYEVLDKMSYDDQSARYEYVIFSDVARKHNIPQYIDNRKVYGHISFAETQEEFAQELFFDTFSFFKQDKHYVVDPVEVAFTRIYKNNEWCSQETVSGTGSELKVTENMRRELAALIKRFEITSISDAPCGDLNWMKHVDIGSCSYVGIDIVKKLIEKNVKSFGSTKEFRHLNLIENIIEKADLIICRDMLAHLTYEQIFSTLSNFKQSGSKYILVTTNVAAESNSNIERVGGWRRLNFELPPFNFPKPIALIEEDVPFELERGKHLALWFLDDLTV